MPEGSGAGVLPVAGILLAGTLLALALSALVVRENVHLHEHVERQALTDPLTPLGNRYALEATLSREANRWRRHRVPFGVVYLDLDEFKAMNEPPLGHRGGDAVLVAVAGVLQDELRDTDEAFRPGGDEFVVVLPHAMSSMRRRWHTGSARQWRDWSSSRPAARRVCALRRPWAWPPSPTDHPTMAPAPAMRC